MLLFSDEPIIDDDRQLFGFEKILMIDYENEIIDYSVQTLFSTFICQKWPKSQGGVIIDGLNIVILYFPHFVPQSEESTIFTKFNPSV